MASVDVRCTVNNCYFWIRDNRCGAEQILITSDAVGRKYPDSVDAQDVSMVVNEFGETPARGCEETACKTFRAR